VETNSVLHNLYLKYLQITLKSTGQIFFFLRDRIYLDFSKLFSLVCYSSVTRVYSFFFVVVDFKLGLGKSKIVVSGI
jgi:hypothetical protein